MADSPILAARCPVEWQQQIQSIATATGRKEAEVVREAKRTVSRQDRPQQRQGCVCQ